MGRPFRRTPRAVFWGFCFLEDACRRRTDAEAECPGGCPHRCCGLLFVPHGGTGGVCGLFLRGCPMLEAGDGAAPGGHRKIRLRFQVSVPDVRGVSANAAAACPSYRTAERAECAAFPFGGGDAEGGRWCGAGRASENPPPLSGVGPGQCGACPQTPPRPALHTALRNGRSVRPLLSGYPMLKAGDGAAPGGHRKIRLRFRVSVPAWGISADTAASSGNDLRKGCAG